MLSAPVPGPELRPGWAVEPKWDGFRALVSVDAGRVVLRSRRGTEMLPAFPEIRAGAARLTDATALDGELVVWDTAGRLAFEQLHNRLQRRGAVKDVRQPEPESVAGSRPDGSWRSTCSRRTTDACAKKSKVSSSAVRRSLGQLDQFGAADLGTRVEELTAENQRLRTERDAAPAEAAELTRHLNEGQDDLAGAREGLRRMIRTESSANGGQ